MKTTSTSPPVRCRALYSSAFYLSGLLALLLSFAARAQFPTSPSTPFYVCNAPGNQFGVQAFADGAGGAYTVWIDKRGGNGSGPGTALYAQRLNAAGVPQLAANGLRLFQTRGREIFGMRAVAWRGGLLVAWVQGAFQVGGDSVRCQYFDAAGAPQWAQPTLIAARVLPNVIYESQEALNILPTSTGATITHVLALNGGAKRFTFNQVNAAGVRAFANNAVQVEVRPASVFASDYYQTVGDGSDGFYLVASAGGFSSPIYAQRFSAAGAPQWANYTVISAGGPSGRGSEWQPLLDPAGNLYVAWVSDSNDPLVSKVLPSGALGWAGPGYVNLCTFASRQFNPYAIWHNNALWMVWEDSRAGTGNFDYGCYAQKIDAAGTLAWSPDGVPLYTPAAAYPRPKLAPSDNGSVMAFFQTDGSGVNFRVQKLLPTGGVAFATNGVLLNSVATPNLNSVADNRVSLLDYVPVGQPGGAVQVYWATTGVTPTGQDISTARVQPTGELLSTAERAAVALGFEAYPNPATSELRLRYPAPGPAPTGLRLYDALGRQVRAFATPARSDGALSLRGLAAGVYVLRAELAGQPVSRRVTVAAE